MTVSKGTPHRSLNLVLVLALGIAGCAAGAARDPVTAEDFTARDTRGETVRLGEHLGRRAVLLVFFSTASRACLPLMPHLANWKRAYGARLAILGIAMDGPDTIAELPAFITRHHVGFPVLFDEDTHIARAYNVRQSNPFFVVIDWRGHVIHVRDGFISGDEIAIRADIEEATTISR